MTRKELLALDDLSLDKIIRIQGTQYDRRRKLNDKQINKASKMLNDKNMSYEEVATRFGVDTRTIRYYFDEAYRKKRISQATAIQHRTNEERLTALIERAAYKRKLVARNRVSV